MSHHRILSLWFPRMGAERLSRRARGTLDPPLAIVAERGNAHVLVSLSHSAQKAGLRRGQGLRDAQAICPELRVVQHDPQAEAAFLAALGRWAGKFSPWVAQEPPAALLLDLTGCAHLFGGEEALLLEIGQDCHRQGLTVRAGIADTVGAAWALARFSGTRPGSERSGDAIDQEAPATRARAVRRRAWERGGSAVPALPGPRPGSPDAGRIAPPGGTAAAIAALPVAALRLDPETVSALSRLGLRRVRDLSAQPRGALARRFGHALIRRLDQALGIEPEPVSPSRPGGHFAVRLTLPDPIGLESDLLAAIDRLLPPLCARLHAAGHSARRLRLCCQRSDGTAEHIELGLARPAHEPDRLRPLLKMKLAGMDAGFGIDMIRLEAHVTEPARAQQHSGHAEALADATMRRGPNRTDLDDLLGRLGARIGLGAITRRHSADSHIPEKSIRVMAAADGLDREDAGFTAGPRNARPLLLWPPEAVNAPCRPALSTRFGWRGRQLEPSALIGPERIAPEWWLDDPAWRSGVRDYWCVTCLEGDRLWLFYAHGATLSQGWFCQGSFA
ncbi:Y-family DNA polymerase [Profundibacterium mesophilum]|uniref:DNA repair enzyme n=1 Tax=Profundibacterium mesophilum KAUST100406-0324 TaxID=1037889 RepID=A0A921TDS0_9RHOB|nr:DNA polymerase Y family protein [Profundibacterium mesophilum]KAF0676512.1 putative DNA repair enzyme [Profundibacterium mesophilum KAUST100406-0324]